MKAARTPTDAIQSSIRTHLTIALIVIATLFGVVGTWAYATSISGAVLAPGLLVVGGNQKKVQHPTGGVVSALLVKDGDRVKAGDVLVRLDDTALRARLNVSENAVDELTVRRARLMADLAGQSDFTVAPPQGRAMTAEFDTIIGQERSVLRAGQQALLSQKEQLNERTLQLSKELDGTQLQADARKAEIAVVQKQIANLQKLLASNLVPKTRLEEAQKEAQRLKGDQGRLLADVAQTRGRISEINLQLLQLDQDHRAEVGKELRETESKLSEAVEREIEARDQFSRLEIRAPQDGVVYQLAVHTNGGVVGAGDTLMMIVPGDDVLKAEVHIAPADIDQVYVGQTAVLRLTAFDQRTTPEAQGRVEFVSPDLVTEPRNGSAYFTVRIALDRASAGDLALLPGMPCEAFIKTRERSVLSYFVKPLADQFMRTFREG